MTALFVAQPIAHWRRLPSLDPEGDVSPGGKAQVARQGLNSILSNSKRHEYMSHTSDTATESESDERTSRFTVPTPSSQTVRIAAKERSTEVSAVSAGFVESASELCCCIAVAKLSVGRHIYLKTLVLPIWPQSAAASPTWQETVLPFVSQEGEPPAEDFLLAITIRPHTPTCIKVVE